MNSPGAPDPSPPEVRPGRRRAQRHLGARRHGLVYVGTYRLGARLGALGHDGRYRWYLVVGDWVSRVPTARVRWALARLLGPEGPWVERLSARELCLLARQLAAEADRRF